MTSVPRHKELNLTNYFSEWEMGVSLDSLKLALATFLLWASETLSHDSRDTHPELCIMEA